MFRAVSIEAFGPFCGRGEYGQITGVGWGKSPAQAIRLAVRRMREDENSKADASGFVGGGVPIFDEIRVTKNGQDFLVTDLYKCRIR